MIFLHFLPKFLLAFDNEFGVMFEFHNTRKAVIKADNREQKIWPRQSLAADVGPWPQIQHCCLVPAVIHLWFLIADFEIAAAADMCSELLSYR